MVCMAISHITFEPGAKILDIVEKLKDVELRNDEDELSEEEAAAVAQIDGDDDLGRGQTQDAKSSSSSPEN